MIPSANSCSICCSLCGCGVLAHMSMSSAKRRWLRYSPSISSSLWFPKSVVGICFRVSVAVNSLDDMVSSCRTPLLMLILNCCFLCVCGLSSSCWCRLPSRVRCTHLLFPVLEARSSLLEFALSGRITHSQRMRCRVGYYILCTSFETYTFSLCNCETLATSIEIQLRFIEGFVNAK